MENKARALLAFYELANAANVDPGHGDRHASIVMKHCSRALAAGPSPKNKLEALAVEIAGALHDADDFKLFKTPPGTYINAQSILENIFPICDYGKDFHERVIRYISYTSCSINGNTTPDDVDPDKEPWWNYVRLADRVEAIGGIGVLRAHSYTLHVNRELFDENTPRVTNDEELAAVATYERFENYLKEKTSATFIDHFYDKLFHIADFDRYTTNPYLRGLARDRLSEMKAFIFSFGKNPTKQNISRWIAKFKVRYANSI